MGYCQFGFECRFFNEDLGNDSEFSTPMKGAYCLNDPEQCAIYRIRKQLGKSALPKDLHPYEWERANEILNEQPVNSC